MFSQALSIIKDFKITQILIIPFYTIALFDQKFSTIMRNNIENPGIKHLILFILISFVIATIIFIVIEEIVWETYYYKINTPFIFGSLFITCSLLLFFSIDVVIDMDFFNKYCGYGMMLHGSSIAIRAIKNKTN